MGNCLGVSDKAPRSSETIRPSSTGTSKNNSNEVRSGLDGGNSANETSKLREMDVDFPKGQILPIPPLTIFTLSDLRRATGNFHPDALIELGEFGTVFKGWLDEGTLAPAKPGSGMVTAVEKLNAESMQGIREWQSAIDFFGRHSHPNLVKLLGYCLDEKEHLLVYEYVAEGSLEQHLFEKVSPPLSWSTRLKILIGAARGLAFLHTSNRHVIYRDFKASNILLDSNYHAKLSDFGLANKAKHIPPKPKPKPSPAAPAPLPLPAPPPPIAGRVMGSQGYTPPPKNVATGHLYDDKSDDVYGFGGVLLEMLSGQRAPDNTWVSGLRALDTSRPSDQQKLVKEVMDKRLEGQYTSEAALMAAQLSLKCLDDVPTRRPSMKEVADALVQIEAKHQKPSAAKPERAKLETKPETARAAKPETARAAKPKTAAPPANHCPSLMV